jgi:diguanylate cyclase (GGDEF)-like protein
MLQLHSTSLLVAASACLAIAAAAAATIGVRQRQRRGTWWWIAANLGLAGALVAHALEHQHEMLPPIAAVLALQWPVVTLLGMRRFFARRGSTVPAWADFVVLVGSLLAVVGAWYLPWSDAVQTQLLIGAMLFSTVYAALALWRLEDFATTPILHGLLVALVGSAILQAAWWAIASFLLVPAPTGADLTFGAWLAPAVVALLMPQLTLVMTHERNVAQLRASHRKLRHMVEVDPLTRLPNRRHFHELAAKAIQPQQELTTVLVFDVDRLKHINEVLGHQIGDEALKQIGTVLRETLRRRDVAGRLGGDEFAAVLPRTRVNDVEAVVTRINTRIDDRQVAPRIARVCLNVGATQMLASETLADALRRAEIKLETDRDKRREAEALADRMADSLPASEVMPALAEALASRRGPPSGAVGLDLIPIGEVVAAANSR